MAWGQTITCHPPLASTTVVDTLEASVEFIIGVPWHGWDDGRRITAACIWHNCRPGSAWSELQLEESAEAAQNNGETDRTYFHGLLSRPSEKASTFRFTLKFRTEHDGLRWIRDISGQDDGEVIFQPFRMPTADLCRYIGLPDDGISVVLHSAHSKSESCLIWELTFPVPAARDLESGLATRILRRPLDVTRWFATVRHMEHWLGPRHGKDEFALDKEAVLLSFLRLDGLHLVAFPASGLDDSTMTLRFDGDGNILATARNEKTGPGTARLLLAVARTVDEAVECLMKVAKEHTHSHRKLDYWDALERGSKADQWAELEEWYDGFAYCTWNGLGQSLSRDKVLEGLAKLEEEGIHASTLIIDDNWQSLDGSAEDPFYRRWLGFEANKEHFPGGLKELVSQIRARHPHIRNIAVWHGIFGYWGGMSPAPTSQIAATYKLRKFPLREGIFLGGGTMTTVDGGDARRLYNDFYTFLADCGVTAVKVDTQSFLDYAAHAPDRLALTRAYQDAWRGAAMRHFGGRAIACMAQIPQTMLYSFSGPRGGSSTTALAKLLVRNSDDFYPDEPASHAWHVFCNAHNAILMRHLHVLPDWDMFQTAAGGQGRGQGQAAVHSRMHAAARCLSGGPIYITDEPGRHDMDLIGEMTARTPDGRLVILRTEGVGRAAWPYEPFGGGGGDGGGRRRLLMIRTEHKGVGMLGAFNLRRGFAAEFVRLGSFCRPGGEEEAEYVLRLHGSGDVEGPLKPDGFVEVGLEEGECEILTACPVHSLGGKGGSAGKVAVLGLLGKMAGAAAISSLRYDSLTDGEGGGAAAVEISLVLRALGVLGVSVHPQDGGRPSPSCIVNLSALGRQVETGPGGRFVSVAGHVLCLDLEGIWKEAGLMPCTRDEAGVEVVMTLRLR